MKRGALFVNCKNIFCYMHFQNLGTAFISYLIDGMIIIYCQRRNCTYVFYYFIAHKWYTNSLIIYCVLRDCSNIVAFI